MFCFYVPPNEIVIVLNWNSLVWEHGLELQNIDFVVFFERERWKDENKKDGKREKAKDIKSDTERRFLEMIFDCIFSPN